MKKLSRILLVLFMPLCFSSCGEVKDLAGAEWVYFIGDDSNNQQISLCFDNASEGRYVQIRNTNGSTNRIEANFTYTYNSPDGTITFGEEFDNLCTVFFVEDDLLQLSFIEGVVTFSKR